MGYKNLGHKESASKTKLKHSVFVTDWKNAPDQGDLESALKPHGLHVHPLETNDDSVAYHVTNRKMTTHERAAHDKEYNNPYEE